jgi:glutamine synthetase
MFRSLVKQLAQKHGYLASFMPKPFHDASGSGFHCHYSLWRDGRNIFADGGQLSDTGRYFVGGLQQRMAETALCGSPTPNGFRRRVVNSFCPTNASWGIDNRTAGLRVIEGSDSGTRVEKRDAGADANPYFLMAADIAAGLDGIEGHIEPGPVSVGNAYKDAEAPPIPTNIRTAIDLARGSDWLRGVMGDDQFEMMVQQSEREEAFFAKQVTQVELDRYLRNF